MWWLEIRNLHERVAEAIGEHGSRLDPTAIIEPGAIIDDSTGPIVIGPGTRVCTGAVLRGPLFIGADCLIGNQSMVRGPSLIADEVRIGFACEIKQSLVAARVMIGPQCFVGDSKIDEDAYLGAQVRTSNQRLDKEAISVRDCGREIPTNCDKLGCWIGARASLGIQVIVLPGRVIAEDSLFEPRVTIARNHPTGRYRARQSVELVA
jgi:bifunctional UDP-N-acetylglucosamine pyrophosphorylase/glucosamine-1-phosphate N-acetyltransferase